MARAPFIMSTSFVDECLSQDKMLDPRGFLLKDIEGEKRLGFSLDDALKRAKSNKQRLLQGFVIYCTETVQGGFDTYKSIIEANGGVCMLYRARAGLSALPSVATHRDKGEDETSDDPACVYLISGLHPDEKRLWRKFRQMVRSSGKTPKIVRTDWLLDIALSQQIQSDPKHELTDEDATSGA